MAVQYGSLQVSESQPRPANASRATFVALISLSAAVMFFAGRTFKAQTAPFSYSEVVAAENSCADDEFIGGCVDCSSCAAYEFANGGCTFFKDTFCSFCEPIDNCPRENIECESRADSKCNECVRPSPINAWNQVELSYFHNREMQNMSKYASVGEDSATFEAYWNDDCRPCTVCNEGKYQEAPCDQNNDTVCRTCDQCEFKRNDTPLYVKEVCTYDTDTVCAECTQCGVIEGESFTSKKCDLGKAGDIGYMQFARAGSDAECGECTTCGEDEWYSQACTVEHDSECSACSVCGNDRVEGFGGQRIANDGEITPEDDGKDGRCCAAGNCKDGVPQGIISVDTGSDTICTECPDLPEGYWEVLACDPNDYEETPVFEKCTVCPEGQFTETECTWNADAVCTPCTWIPNCDADAVSCSTADDASCCNGSYSPACCNTDFEGNDCCYMKQYTDCGSGPGFKQYVGAKMGFNMSPDPTLNEMGIPVSTQAFIDWCRELCDDTAECLSFEVTDNGSNMKKSGPAVLGRKDECVLHNNFAFVQGSCHATGQTYDDIKTVTECTQSGYADAVWGLVANPYLNQNQSEELSCVDPDVNSDDDDTNNVQSGVFCPVYDDAGNLTEDCNQGQKGCYVCYTPGKSYPWLTSEDACTTGCPIDTDADSIGCQWDEKDGNDVTYGLPDRTPDCYNYDKDGKLIAEGDTFTQVGGTYCHTSQDCYVNVCRQTQDRIVDITDDIENYHEYSNLAPASEYTNSNQCMQFNACKDDGGADDACEVEMSGSSTHVWRELCRAA